MREIAGLRSQSFDWEPAAYLARQDRIFAAAAEAVLRLGKGYLDRWDALVAIETKAASDADGCLYVSATSEDEKPVLLALDARRITRWLFQPRYRVTLYWGVSDQLVAPVIQLCDPAAKAQPTQAPSAAEPLAARLIRQLPGKDVVGCKPGYVATMSIRPDGKFQLKCFRDPLEQSCRAAS